MSFGVLIPRKPVLTNFRQVNRTKFICNIDNKDRIKELMVFLLPNSPKLPDNAGFSIYMADNNKVFEYLGYINNSRPSELIHVPDTFRKKGNNNPNQNMYQMNGPTLFGPSSQQQNRDVLFIGLQLQPRNEIENLEQGNREKEKKFNSQVGELANYLTESMTNYCSSFSQYLSHLQKEMIVMPLDAMNKWMLRLKNRFKNDPYFWKKKSGKVM